MSSDIYRLNSIDRFPNTSAVIESFGNDYETHRRFGTYCLINGKYDSESWELFKQKDFSQAVREALPNLHIATIIAIARRHPDLLYIFLDFFDHFATRDSGPKEYITFLMQMIPYTPVRWFVKHCLRIKEVRIVYVGITAFFAHAMFDGAHLLPPVRNNNQTFELYKSITDDDTPDDTYLNAWQNMTDYRTSSRELIDYKLDVRLSEYLKKDKAAFVKQLIKNHDTVARLTKSLKTQIVPYCEANSISHETQIAKVVPTKRWPVEAKLQIIQEFVPTPSIRHTALEYMDYNDDTELEKIREFAKKNNIQYEPDPEKYAKIMTEGPQKVHSRMTHSVSIESFTVKEPQPRSPSSLEKWKRSPSIDLNLTSTHQFDGAVAHLADGQPDNPQEYADKLRKFRNLKEIRPIFDLAESFQVVVSYEDYNDIWGKRVIFGKCIEQAGWDKFDLVCSALGLDSTEVLDIVGQGESYLSNCSVILPKLFQYITRTNVETFARYTNDAMHAAIEHTPLSEVAPLWADCLQRAFSFVAGPKVEHFLLSVRVLDCLTHLSDTKLAQTVYGTFMYSTSIESTAQILINAGMEDEAHSLLPFPSPREQTQRSFSEDFTSGDSRRISKAILDLAALDDETAVPILQATVKKLGGTEYSMLWYALLLLQKRGVECPTEIEALNTLHIAAKHSVDFHQLMADPLGTIKENVNIDNIWMLKPLCDIFSINPDDIIVYVIVYKMNSPYFDDYRELVHAMRDKTNNELLQHLVPRFSPDDLSFFFSSIGMLDMKRKTLTIKDLKAFGLAEFLKDELLDDPKKLIHELYCKENLHDTLGKRLHKLAEGIAGRYRIDVVPLRYDLIREWLTTLEGVDEVACSNQSVFSTTICEARYDADNRAVQKALFLLRKFPVRDAIVFLHGFASNAEPRPRARALSAMFGVADEATVTMYCGDTAQLAKQFERAFYMMRIDDQCQSRDELRYTEADFDEEKMEETIANMPIEPGFDLIRAEYYIENPERLAPVLVRLADSRKLYVIRLVPRLASSPVLHDERVIKAIHHAVSAPFEELINHSPTSKPFKTKHQNIIRDTMWAIALLPPFTTLELDGKEADLVTIAAELCRAGHSQIAAELGSHMADPLTRDRVMRGVIAAGHYDAALQFGFEEGRAFEEIVMSGVVAGATETMVDKSFVRFTAWLHRNNDTETLNLVETALRNQGRTREVRRMRERLAAMANEM